MRRRSGAQLRRRQRLHERLVQHVDGLRQREQHRLVRRRQRLHDGRYLCERRLRRRPCAQLQRQQRLHERLVQPGDRLRQHEQHGAVQRRQRLHDTGYVRRRHVCRGAGGQLQRQQRLHGRFVQPGDRLRQREQHGVVHRRERVHDRGYVLGRHVRRRPRSQLRRRQRLHGRLVQPGDRAASTRTTRRPATTATPARPPTPAAAGRVHGGPALELQRRQRLHGRLLQPGDGLRPHEQHRRRATTATPARPATPARGGLCVGRRAAQLRRRQRLHGRLVQPGDGLRHTRTTRRPAATATPARPATPARGGLCVGGTPPNCNDGNVCTNDSCNPAHGLRHTRTTRRPAATATPAPRPTRAPRGTCVGGAPPTCDDSNVCTDDSCNPATGCVNANNTASCNDGERLHDGRHLRRRHLRRRPGAQLQRRQRRARTTRATRPPAASTRTTRRPAATATPARRPTRARAAPASRGPAPRCNDGNVCTDDSCNPATGCVNTNNTASCSDGNACTTADTCAGGTCVGGPAPSCNDGNVCTDDSCNPATGCVTTNNTASCSDGNACTTADTCAGGSVCRRPGAELQRRQRVHRRLVQPGDGLRQHEQHGVLQRRQRLHDGATPARGGTCVGGPAPNCNDGNVCTDDSCNPATGCVNANNTAPCNDGNACTTADTCAGGTCAGRPGARLQRRQRLHERLVQHVDRLRHHEQHGVLQRRERLHDGRRVRGRPLCRRPGAHLQRWQRVHQRLVQPGDGLRQRRTTRQPAATGTPARPPIRAAAAPVPAVRHPTATTVMPARPTRAAR